MRNLKRALSLTLASIMLLGMMVLGTSAASYTDEDQISNKTAAAVLKELNIMVGDGTSFGPETTVTRGQMAIIICKMLYGNNLNVSQFSGTTQFDDVPANSYYTGYVNLANSLGIISGYGDGNFGPGDPVSTAQAALMLCRALGYFQAGELTGQGWGNNALTAITQATKLGLFGDLKLETNDPLSRDNVAEMSFNALTKATPVMYNDLWHMYYTDSESIMSGIKFRYDETLGYRNYDLVYTAGEDDFGRPTTIWGTGDLSRSGTNVIKDNGDIDTTIFTNIPQTNQIVEEANAPTASYDGKVSRVTLYNLIGRSAVNRLENDSNTTDGNDDTPHWYVFTDGEEYVGYNKTIFFDREDTTSIGRCINKATATTRGDNGLASSNPSYVSYAANDLTGDGTHTDVYVDNDGNVTIVISNTYVIKATNDYSSRNDSVTTALVSNNGTKTSAQIGIPSSELTLSGEDFDVSGVKMDDYLLVTVAGSGSSNKEIKSVAPANVITGTVDEFDDDSVTIAGTKYGYAFTADSTSSHGKAVVYAINEETSVVADQDGNILYVDEVTVSAGRFVYIAGVQQKTGNFTENKFVANAYFLDGTNPTIDLKKELKGGTAVAPTEYYTAEDASENPSHVEGSLKEGATAPGWYRYTVSDNVYTLEALSAGSAENNTGSVSTPAAEDKKLTENGSAKVGVDVGGGTAVSANNNTVFVVIDENDEVHAYVGIDNAPTVQSSAAAALTAHYVRGTNGSYAKYVFIDASANATVDAGASDEYIYLLKSVRDGTDGKEVGYRLWEAIVNGEKTTVKLADNATTNVGGGDTDADRVDHLYGNVRYNSDGYIRAMDVVDSGDNYVSINLALGPNVTYEGDVLTLASGASYNAKDARIWLIARDGNLMTKGSSYEIIGTNANVTNGAMTASGLYGYLRIYDVTGKYWVQTTDGKANSKATDIYVLVTSTVRNDVANVTMDSGSTGSAIDSQLSASGTTSVTVSDPVIDSSVTVGADKTLNMSGTISGGGSITGAGDVNISSARVTEDLDLSGVSGDVTLSGVTVGASTEVEVKNVTLSGTITLNGKLNISGNVTLGTSATISASEGAKIVVGSSANVSALAGIAGLKFYDENGDELSFASRALVSAGTYEYKVDWDGGDGSIDPAITGWVLDAESVPAGKTKISSVTLTGVTAPATGSALGEPTCSTSTVNMTYSWGSTNTKDTVAAAETVYTLTVTLTVANSSTHEFDSNVSCTLDGVTGVWNSTDGTLTFEFPETDA